MIEKSQRYVSRELSHFVGRGYSEPDQYSLLVKILQSGWLTYSPDSPNESLGEILIRPNAKISENELYNPGMVCLCDIPIQDLAIHIRKYSPFGLAFSKAFVIKSGGTPVYYLPRQAKVRTRKRLSSERVDQLAKKNLNPERMSIEIEDQDWALTTKADYFDKMLEKYHEALRLFSDLINQSPNHPRKLDHHYDLDDLRLFLDFHVFSYVKFFDHNLPEYDIENYYFEREWRIINSLKFELEDVIRVLIPKKYAKHFRQDCPNYFGQITFIDM